METPVVDPLLPADAVPAGAVVLSTDGTDRRQLRAGFFAWSAGMFMGGVVVGILLSRRRR